MKYLRSKFAETKACIIAFVISRFAPDYEQIKAENKELRSDIYNLIRNENKVDGLMVKVRYNMRYDMEDCMMAGSRTTEPTKFGGISSQIAAD